MNKNKLIFIGTCIGIGIGAGALILGNIKKNKAFEKAIEEKNLEEAEKIDKEIKRYNQNADVVFKIAYAVIALKCAYDIIKKLDERSRVNFLITIMNSSLIGNIDSEVAKEIVEKHYPTFSEPAKRALEPFIIATFPNLLGGE